ncbi:uncharacterized protein LOC143289442 [Babylonia areolata]|uniref:uncharacterized protein LOC143289440 n=1 Tax=Babylonia areolata TaxID=304850 RepID=UPI003FCF917A
MEWTAVSCVMLAIFLSTEAESAVSSPPEDRSLSPDPSALYDERVTKLFSDLKELLKQGDSHLKERIEEGLEHVKEQRKEGDRRLKEELDEDVEWLKERQDKRQRQTEDELAEGEAKMNKEMTELKESVEKLRDSVKQWTQPDSLMTKDLKQQLMSDFRSELDSTNQQMSDFRSQLNSTNQQMSDFRSQLNSTNQQMPDFRSELDSTKQQLHVAVEMIRSLNASLVARQAAFRAVLKDPQVTAHAPIPFGQDFVAGEGDYDPESGVYTVAIPGVYSLGFQLFPKVLTSFIIDLYINGSIMIRSRCYGSEGYETSCGASSVFRLQRGDRVWVQTQYGGEYWAEHHSYFFGALLSPDP